MNAIRLIWDYLPAFLSGLTVTFFLVTLTAVIGTLLAIGLELVCQKAPGWTRRVVDEAAFWLSSIPALVILFWLHYPAQSLLGIVVAPFLTALLALTIINTMAVYRIVGDAIRDFPSQYISSARVCGLSKRQIMRKIQLPLLLRTTLPRWIDQQVVILHTSLFASLISVEEIFRVSQRVNSVIYQPVLIYTSMALLFLVSAGTALYISNRLRQRNYRDLSEK